MKKEEAVKILKNLLMEVYYEDEPPKIGVERTRAIQIAIDIIDKDTKVRCKNCKYFGIMRAGMDMGGYCTKLEWTSREPNDFCSWAVEGDNDYKKKRREP